jgi:hypothetical protein
MRALEEFRQAEKYLFVILIRTGRNRPLFEASNAETVRKGLSMSTQIDHERNVPVARYS